MPNIIHNQAEVTYHYEQSVGNIRSNIVETIIEDRQPIKAHMTSLQSAFNPGEVITYLIQIENTGADPLSVTMKVCLPIGSAYLLGSLKVFINSVETPITSNVEANILCITLPKNMSPQDKGIILYCMKVDPNIDPCICAITSSLYITAHSEDGSTFTAEPPASVTLLKETASQLVLCGQWTQDYRTLTYTIQLLNYGNQEASHITLMDWLPISFNIHQVIAETNESQVIYQPDQYQYHHSNGMILLPNANTASLNVPAATLTSPGRTVIKITGTIAK